MTLFEHVQTVLQQKEAFCTDGQLFKNTVVEAALKLDPALLKLLIKDPTTKQQFFSDVEGILVFDKISFQKFISNKQFLPDSFTAYKNKIGLTANGEYLTEANEVVLDFPYKDCVLEGGQTRDDKKRQEVLWNQTLAPDEIDRLFEPKVFSEWKQYNSQSAVAIDAIPAKSNFLFKGNNLLTLSSISKVFNGKIKLIYIDPPYNTGKDSFLYNDSFNHSTWLTFMKNRLEVSKGLLKQDGVIFISIDITEQAYLKVLCDEVFGRDNFVGEIIWETATDNNATQISIEHEYVLCYAKNKEALSKWQITSDKARFIVEKHKQLAKIHGADTEAIEKALRAWINSQKKSNELDLSGVSHYSYVDERGVFYPGNSANTKPGGYMFDIVHPITRKVCKKPSNGYRWPEDTFWEADRRKDVLWPSTEAGIPKIKKRIETATELLKGYFYEDNRKSTKELAKVMGQKVFDNPKSINLLKKIIRFSTGEKDLVLDFFAGSGSTAQAVAEVNAESGSNRRFILIEQMDYISTVTIPRIQKTTKEEFIYAELTEVQHYLSAIQNAGTLDTLKAIADSILREGLHSYHVPQEIEKAFGKGSPLDLAERKKLLLSILDKNSVYLPYSEIDDSTFGINAATKKLNKQFYDLPT
ncbi:MAG: site-specific DNA-methyltransferase [Flavobacteriales bacterium]